MTPYTQQQVSLRATVGSEAISFKIDKLMFKKMRRAISIIIILAFISTSVKSPAYAQTAQGPDALYAQAWRYGAFKP